MKILDTHLHVWDLETMNLPWLEGMPTVLNRTYTEDDYRLAIKLGSEYQIEAAVYMEVDAASDEKEKEYCFLNSWVENKDSIIKGGIISANLESKDFPRYLDSHNHSSVKGVRHVLHVSSSLPGTCLKENFVRNIQELGKRGMVFEACMRTEELDDLYQLALQCPDTYIILNHMGNVDTQKIYLMGSDDTSREYGENWLKQLRKLATLSNVICKVSGLNPVGDWDVDRLKPTVDYVLDIFGEDNIVFGGNFPVCNISMTVLRWIEVLDEITRSRPETLRKKLFYENAEQIYNIKCN